MSPLWLLLDRLFGERRFVLSLRWLSWCLAALLVIVPLAPSRTLSYAPMLLLAALLPLLFLTLLLPQLSLPKPLLLVGAIDALLALLLVLASDGWESPFVIYGYSSLVLPLLVLSRARRLVMALLYTLADLLTLLASSLPLQQILEHSPSMVLLRLAMPLLLALLLRADQPELTALRPVVDQRLQRGLEGAARRFQRIALLSGPTAGGREPAALLEIQSAADRGERELQGLLALLCPAVPDTVDLVAQFRKLALEFQERSGVAAQLTVEGQPRQLAPAIEATLLSAGSEALNNVEKHAHAQQVQLLLRYDPSDIVLTISDDGVGLMDGPVDRPGCRGLRALQYRVAELNGQLDIADGERHGVVLRISVPLEVYAA